MMKNEDLGQNVKDELIGKKDVQNVQDAPNDQDIFWNAQDIFWNVQDIWNAQDIFWNVQDIWNVQDAQNAQDIFWNVQDIWNVHDHQNVRDDFSQILFYDMDLHVHHHYNDDE